MKIRILFGIICLTSWFLTVILLPAGGTEEILCEDGEEFTIEEKTIIESSIPSISNEKIVIDCRKLRLIFYRNGRPEKSYPVAIGTDETPTPIGEWKIIHKGGNWGNGFGVRWLGLNVPWGIYGIHGTNKPWSVGSRASHGCIRMFNSHVLELYNLVKIDTPVYIIGDLPKVWIRKEFRPKASGKDVLLLQFALRKAGFNPGMADARYGTGTELAVRNLQAFYGLAQTGKAGLDEQYIIGLRQIHRGEKR